MAGIYNLRFIQQALISTVSQGIGRAVNVAIALIVISIHGATSLTDSFFLSFAVAFFFFGTLANAITDATVPLVVSGKVLPSNTMWLKVAFLAVLISFGVTWCNGSQNSLSTYLSGIGAGLMAGSGILAGFFTAFLHANRYFAVTGLLWIVRLIPLSVFLFFPSEPEAIYWLIIGIGLADVCRCMIMRNLASKNVLRNKPLNLPAKHEKTGFFYYFPILIASGINGVNPLVDRWIAGLGEPGSIAILDTAERIYNILGTISTIGVMNVLLVSVSQLHTQGSLKKVWPRIMSAIGLWSLLWLIVGVALKELLPAWLEHHTGLTPFQAHETGTVYFYYVCGLPAFIISIATVRYLLAVGSGHILVFTAILSVFLNAIISFGLFRALGVAGIALGTTVTYSFLVVIVLMISSNYNRNLSTR